MKTVRLLARVLVAPFFALALVYPLFMIHQHKLLRDIYHSRGWGKLADEAIRPRKLPGYYDEVSMVVQKNHRFSLIDDHAWGNTLPDKLGFIGLGPKGIPFDIAEYHQIHCLNAIRFAYTVARDGLVKDAVVMRKGFRHHNHCFNYIRQSILCKADSTLLPLNEENRTLAHAGFGVMHRCHNWAQVRHFVLQSRKKWDGIPTVFE